jgi:hopanoid-associated phosphorylase
MSGQPFITVVTGMLAEARIAAGLGGVRTISGGGNGHRLAREVERSIEDGSRAIVSFGIAGGLCPTMAPGSVVVAREVVHGEERWVACPDWSTRLLTLIPDAHHLSLAGTDTPVACVKQKRHLHQTTRAAAVDMESHISARLAHRHNVPFAALRVVADGAHRALPSAALAGFGEDGRIDVLGVIRALARRPQELPALLKLSADSRAAFAALLRCGSSLAAEPALGSALALRPSLGLADLG